MTAELFDAEPVTDGGSSAKVAEADGRLGISVEEAGALLGISRDLAYDLVRRREIPAVRLGRRWIVPRRALEQLMEPEPMQR